MSGQQIATEGQHERKEESVQENAHDMELDHQPEEDESLEPAEPETERSGLGAFQNPKPLRNEAPPKASGSVSSEDDMTGELAMFSHIFYTISFTFGVVLDNPELMNSPNCIFFGGTKAGLLTIIESLYFV